MAERFSRVFSLGENMHTPGVPVVVAAGVLLKDHFSGKILAQLKLQNVGEKKLQSIKVRIQAFDMDGTELPGVDSHSYLDLSVAFGEFCGAQTPIALADSTTRKIAVTVLSAVAEDGTVFQAEGDVAAPASDAVTEVLQSIVQEENRKKQAKAKVQKIVIGVSAFSLVLALVPRFLLSQAGIDPLHLALSLLAPVLCVVMACMYRKKPKLVLVAGSFAVVMLLLQVSGGLGIIKDIRAETGFEGMVVLPYPIFMTGLAHKGFIGKVPGITLMYALDCIGIWMKLGAKLELFVTPAYMQRIILPAMFYVLSNVVAFMAALVAFLQTKKNK